MDVQNVEGTEEIITPSKIHFRRPKYLIDIDTNILKSLIKDVWKNNKCVSANQLDVGGLVAKIATHM